MGFIDKSTLTADAILTRRGRGYMAKAMSGETTDEHVITKFALADDEIDYSLWDMTPSGSNYVRPLGAVIDNQPLIEAVVSTKEIMNYLLTKKEPIFTTDPEVPEISDSATLERERQRKEQERQRKEQRRNQEQQRKEQERQREEQQKRQEERKTEKEQKQGKFKK